MVLHNYIGVDLSGRNFSGADLKNTDFSHANLSNANLAGADLRASDLYKTNLKHANLTGANLIGVDMIEADLSDANLSRGIMTGSDFSNAMLVNADLSEANLRGADFKGANLTKANLIKADLSGANLRVNNIDGNLINTILSGANLTEADLSGAFLTEADLKNANLTDANLIGALLIDADLQNSDLKGANLRGASLIGANLTEADFANVDLEGADLTNVNMAGANVPAAKKLFGPNTTAKFKVGDQVQEKSEHAPVMVIQSIDEESRKANCSWFNINHMRQNGYFSLEDLKNINEKNAKYFIDNRFSLIKKNEGILPLTKHGNALVLHCVPLNDLDSNKLHNMEKLDGNRSKINTIGKKPGNVTIKTNGILASHKNKNTCNYTYVFTNGVIESVCDSFKHISDESRLPSITIVEDLVEIIPIHLNFLESINASLPILIQISILGLEGVKMVLPIPFPFDKETRAHKENEIHLDPIVLNDYEVKCDAAKLLKNSFDQLWNSFGLVNCTLYDDNGILDLDKFK